MHSRRPAGLPPDALGRTSDGDRELLLTASELALQALHHGLRRNAVLADRRVEHVEVLVVERVGDRAQRVGVCELLDRETLPPERLRQRLASGVDRVDPTLT